MCVYYASQYNCTMCVVYVLLEIWRIYITGKVYCYVMLCSIHILWDDYILYVELRRMVGGWGGGRNGWGKRERGNFLPDALNWAKYCIWLSHRPFASPLPLSLFSPISPSSPPSHLHSRITSHTLRHILTSSQLSPLAPTSHTQRPPLSTHPSKHSF